MQLCDYYNGTCMAWLLQCFLYIQYNHYFQRRGTTYLVVPTHQHASIQSRSLPCRRCPDWPGSHGQRCRHHGRLSSSWQRHSAGNTSPTARATRTRRPMDRSLLKHKILSVVFWKFQGGESKPELEEFISKYPLVRFSLLLLI